MIQNRLKERSLRKPFQLLAITLLIAGLLGCATSPPHSSSADAADQGDRELRRGIHWYQKGCLRKAMDHVYAAHEHYCLADDQAGVARSLNSLANIFLQTGDVNSALVYYDAAISSGQRCDDPSVVARALSNKAAALIDAGDLSAAEVLLDKAQLLSREAGPVFATILNHRAVLLMRAQRYEEALSILDQATASIAGNASSAAATILFTRGRLMMETGHDAKALRYFQETLELDRRAGFTRGIADDLSALADLHEQLGEDETALDCLDRSIKIYALLQNRTKVATSLRHLDKLARKTGTDVQVSVHFINQWVAGETVDAICK
jgi:tetratricopeptide (TPR) repeat protein